MSKSDGDLLLLVFKGLNPIGVDSNKMKSILYSEFMNDKKYSNFEKIWLFVKNEDTYDGTYFMINIITHSPLLKRIIRTLETKGYKLGKFDSIGEKSYQTIEGLVDIKKPEYCEIHLENSKADHVAREIINFLSGVRGRISISSPH